MEKINFDSQQFINWLKKEGIYWFFLTDIEIYVYKIKKCELSEILNGLPIQDIICHIFLNNERIKQLDKKYKFWCAIHDKWVKKVRELEYLLFIDFLEKYNYKEEYFQLIKKYPYPSVKNKGIINLYEKYSYHIISVSIDFSALDMNLYTKWENINRRWFRVWRDYNFSTRWNISNL